MEIAVLLGIFMLLWEIGVFVMCMFLKTVFYMIAFMIAKWFVVR